MLRPSARSTINESSFTEPSVARRVCSSVAEMTMPLLYQAVLVGSHHAFNPAKLGCAESAAAFEPNRVEPELGHLSVAPDVHLHWLLPIVRVEEETLGAVGGCAGLPCSSGAAWA